ncbi:sugar-binding domain-containing protein [Symbiobacterium terraclitae]|uniref:sugar-binding domain-containing protein n=1 Tax=Symbiobacterium terraclitae TaxID=557451 RepID=UPI0035B549F0
MRERLSLNGAWRFQPTPGAPYNDPDTPPAALTEPRTIAVPGCIQAQFADLRDYADVSVYERTFTVPAAWAGRAVRLHFGAVDYLAEVWIDGRYVGDHEGGFLPFWFDITRYVAFGREHRLTVRVTDPGGAAWPEREYRPFPDISFQEAPHGKQSWYGSIGGIWQDVWLEAGSPVWLYRVLATPDVAGGQVHFRAILAGPEGPLSSHAAPTGTRLAGQGPAGRRAPGPVPAPDMPEGHWSVQVRVTGPDGATYASPPAPVAAGEARVSVRIPEPALWAPEHPDLYEFEAVLLEGSTPVDRLEDHFGMRTVEARENRIYLNGRPLYIRAALDQDYYPVSLWTPPDDAFLMEQVRLAKELGLNMLRCHIKAPHPRYLYWADKLGLLVWEEYGNPSNSQGRAPELCRATLEGLIERDYNHPATVIWSVINESWGLDLSQERDRTWLAQMYDHFKAYDPTRLITDNSACPGNFHMATDLADYHSYYAYPDHFDRWEAWVADLAGRPGWIFSPHGDGRPTGQEPLMNSEFGNWGLPDAHDLLDGEGREPWWFATGATWNEGVVHPAGVRERYAGSALPAVFGAYRDFVRATQVQQFRALKHEIEAMRQRPSLNGYVITEFTDVHWECNGLLNQNRQPKAGHALYPTVIAGTQLIARPAGSRWALAAGETVAVRVQVASDSPAAAPGCTVCWWLEEGVATPLPGPGVGPRPGAQRGSLPGVILPAFGVAEAGTLRFRAPVGAQRVRLHLALLDRHGREICRGYEDFGVYVRPRAEGVRLWLDPDLAGAHPGLAGALEALGYAVTAGGLGAAGDLALASRLEGPALAHVAAGGRVLLLAGAPQDLPGGLRIVDRKDGQWHGDWASGWHWLRPGLLGESEAALENPLDLDWAGLLPEHVVLGAGEAQADWLAGYVLGWVRLPAATALGFRLGRGSVLATTFRVAGSLAGHPAAAPLLAGLIARLRDPAFRPALHVAKEAR